MSAHNPQAEEQSNGPSSSTVPLTDLSATNADPNNASGAMSSVDAPKAESSFGAHRKQPSTANRDVDNLLKQRPDAKRKRSRVNPEQFVELEREFAINRTPTSSQRKAIAERLGMNERQTQIWFQNR
jgi:hypothetical protein